MDYRDLIQTYLQKKRDANPRFSMRALAKRLDIEPSTLSQVLRGKRNLPAAEIPKVISRLELSLEDQKAFVDSARAPSAARSYQDYLATPVIESTKNQIVENILEKNVYASVLSLMDTASFQPDPTWMARRLDIPFERVVEVWSDLQAVGLVENVDGIFIKKHVDLRTTDEKQNRLLVNAHVEELELAQAALHEIPLELRDFVSMTFAVDRRKLKKAKVLVRTFLKEMSELLEVETADEVYLLNVQLLPRTKIETKNSSSIAVDDALPKGTA